MAELSLLATSTAVAPQDGTASLDWLHDLIEHCSKLVVSSMAMTFAAHAELLLRFPKV